MQHNTEEQLTFLLEAHPASPLVSPANSKALPMKDTSGPKWSELSESADQLSSFLRTFLASELQRLTSYSLIWKKQATPQGRLWWVLGRSVRPISETGYGLWPTPKALTGGANSNRKARGAGGPDLQESVKTWHTPRAIYGEHPGMTSETHLTGQAMNWATPTVQDGENCAGPSQLERNSQPLNVQVVMDWPTPNAAKAAQDLTLTCPGDGRTKPNKLGWAVSTSDGHQDPDSLSTTGKPQEQWPTPRAETVEGYPSADRRPPPAQKVGTLRLNPEFVRQLMGYPEGWLDIE